MLKSSRSYSRPNLSSSHLKDRLSDSMAQDVRPASRCSTKMRRATCGANGARAGMNGCGIGDERERTTSASAAWRNTRPNPRVWPVACRARTHLLAGAGDEGVLMQRQVARHKREQVGGLGEGVAPHGEVAPARRIARVHQVPVGQQHGAGGLVRLHAHRVRGHHVRAVLEGHDVAEALAAQGRAREREIGGEKGKGRAERL